MRKLYLLACSLITLHTACAQTSTHMDFEKYTPTSTLVVPEHKLTHARYPFIDVHNHQNNMSPSTLRELVNDMDKLNMAVMVNLSGDNGKSLQNKLDNIRSTSPKRFIVFANI